MRAVCLLLLLCAMPVMAQDGVDAFDDFDDDWDEQERGLPWSGFIELAYGRRVDKDARFPTRATLSDLRTRLETEWSNDAIVLTAKADALYDDYKDDYESGSDLDFRELSVQVSPADAVDLKFGRQVLTWGTGDLLFLNDLFPKSWVSFFSGRDDEYLKAPSDALRLTWYTDRINVDAVWSPRFEPDDYLTGARFAFFSPIEGAVVAPQPPLSAREPGSGFNDGELAARLFSTVGSTEYAGYIYRGFYKRPLGLDANFEPYFPKLAAYGASIRRPLMNGLFNAELAYHQSRQDRRGTNPLIPNDQLRVLLGYEFEAQPRLTVGLQYYLEQTQDYRSLLTNSPTPSLEADRRRHVLTNRLTYRTSQDRLTLSLFTFFSPSDDDSYLRPSISFRHSDRWTFVGGANLFQGKQDHTFFGQLEDNSNAYFRARFNF